MEGIAAQLAEQYPNTNAGWSTDVTPMQEYEVRDVKLALLFLFGAVVLVLLIACANVANLLLARRDPAAEMAIRSALGNRWRVVGNYAEGSLACRRSVGCCLRSGHDSLLALRLRTAAIKDVSLDARVLGFTLLSQ